MNAKEKIELFLKEDSTADAFKTLQASLKWYEENGDKEDTSTKEVIETLKGIENWYKENGSFTPGQAQAIYNISNGIKKMTS